MTDRNDVVALFPAYQMMPGGNDAVCIGRQARQRAINDAGARREFANRIGQLFSLQPADQGRCRRCRTGLRVHHLAQAVADMFKSLPGAVTGLKRNNGRADSIAKPQRGRLRRPGNLPALRLQLADFGEGGRQFGADREKLIAVSPFKLLLSGQCVSDCAG